MKINTTRFGELELTKEDIIHFPDGILGFEKLQDFYLVDPNDSTLVVWLQSTTNPAIAFPLIEPAFFKPDYTPDYKAELPESQQESYTSAQLYTILTIPQDVTLMSANMKAPVLINLEKKIGKQIVLQDNRPSIRYEMYKDLKKYLAQNVSPKISDDAQRTSVEDPANHPSEEILGKEETISSLQSTSHEQRDEKITENQL